MAQMSWLSYLVDTKNEKELVEFLKGKGFKDAKFAAKEFLKAGEELEIFVKTPVLLSLRLSRNLHQRELRSLLQIPKLQIILLFFKFINLNQHLKPTTVVRKYDRGGSSHSPWFFKALQLLFPP